MARLSSPYVTPERYLELERSADFRSEYYQGSVFPMSRDSLRHSIILANILGMLGVDPTVRKCHLYAAGACVQVKAAELYTYPDITIVCGQPAHGDAKKDTLTNPTLIFEVLSPSTQDYDRGRKFQNYRALPSLREYITVEQASPHVEQWTRQDEHQWLLTEIDGLDNTLRLQSIECSLLFSDIFYHVEFDA